MGGLTTPRQIRYRPPSNNQSTGASMSDTSSALANTDERVTLNGIEYTRSDLAGPTPPPSFNIVVADRGWVFVGRTIREDDGGLGIIDAKCIRRWGTDEQRPGLGWLAANGPTEKSKLEPSGTVRIPAHAVVLTLDTEASLWQ